MSREYMNRVRNTRLESVHKQNTYYMTGECTVHTSAESSLHVWRVYINRVLITCMLYEECT